MLCVVKDDGSFFTITPEPWAATVQIQEPNFYGKSLYYIWLLGFVTQRDLYYSFNRKLNNLIRILYSSAVCISPLKFKINIMYVESSREYPSEASCLFTAWLITNLFVFNLNVTCILSYFVNIVYMWYSH